MALNIFPSEVWGLILELLDDADDMLAVLNAFPDIRADGICHATKPVWLFVKTARFLSRWLTPTENIDCRRVCHKWMHGVDRVLQTCTDAGPFQQEEPNGQQLSVRRPFTDYSAFYIIGTESTTLTSVELMQRFYIDMVGLNGMTEDINPFPTRSVQIVYDYVRSVIVEGENAIDFWSESKSFLSRFGKHIWYLTLNDGRGESKDVFIPFVVNALSQVPNLRCLKIEYIGSDIDSTETYENMSNGYHESTLRCISREEARGRVHNTLESLNIEDCGLPLILTEFLIARHCHFLQKLTIYVHYWRVELGNILPRLIDLTLVRGRVEQLVNLIPSLMNMVLLKFAVDDAFVSQNVKMTILETIMPLLKSDTFNRLQHLQFFDSERSLENVHSGYARECDIQFNHVCLHSIRFNSVTWLNLGISGLVDDLDFLYLFPKLKQLQLWYPVRHRPYFQTNRHLWEVLCPLLSILYVRKWDGKNGCITEWNCTRAEFENASVAKENREAARIESSIAVFEVTDFPFLTI